MHQSTASFGTNITNNITPNSPKQRMRFHSRLTVQSEKPEPIKPQVELSKELLREYILRMQDQTLFIDYEEFQLLGHGEVAISILSYYNKNFQSTGTDQTYEKFSDFVAQMVETVQKRFPFIKVVNKVSQQHSQDIFLQVQFCSNYGERQNLVLYQKDVFEHVFKLRTLVESITLFLRKISLTLKIECEQTDVKPIGKFKLDNSLILQGLRVIIRQKEEEKIKFSTPNKTIVFKSKVMNSQSNKATPLYNIDLQENSQDKQVRVYFSPNKTTTSIFNTMTITNPGDLIHKNYKSSEKKQQVQPVRLFSQSVLTNQSAVAIFPDLVQQIKFYEIEIEGGCIKNQKTQINLEELYQHGGSSLYVVIRVERSDVAQCQIRVKKDNQLVSDARVKVTHIQSDESQTINFSQGLQSYVFWGSINSMYCIDIEKQDCFPQKKNVQILNDNQLEFELVSYVKTQVKFKVYNMIDMQNLNDVKIEVRLPELLDNQIQRGQSDQGGNFSCQGLMFKQLQLYAKCRGYLTTNYDYDIKANSTGQTQQVPMIPDHFSLINQYHILVYVPNAKTSAIDFCLQTPDGSEVNRQRISHQKAKLDIIDMKNQSRLYNFNIHVKSLDPFSKNNTYSFIARRGLNQSAIQSPRTTKSMKQSMRISSPQKGDENAVLSAEECTRIFITFGHEVLDTLMVQSCLQTQEQCFVKIDLATRKVQTFDSFDTPFFDSAKKKQIKQLQVRNKQQAPVINLDLDKMLSKISNQLL